MSIKVLNLINTLSLYFFLYKAGYFNILIENDVLIFMLTEKRYFFLLIFV